MNCRSPSQRTNSGHVLLIHTLDGMGCEVSFLQDKLSSDRDFQKATVTLFFFNFFHILPRSSPMNHENVCPSYSFSCPMSRIHLGFCTFFLFEAFRPTITIVRVTSSHIQYNHHPHSCLREDISLSPYPSLGVKNDPGNCCSSTRHFEWWSTATFLWFRIVSKEFDGSFINRREEPYGRDSKVQIKICPRDLRYIKSVFYWSSRTENIQIRFSVVVVGKVLQTSSV